MKSVLIAGAGRFGYYAAMKLHDLGHQVMIVDLDEAKINLALPYCTDARIGDSTDPDFMKSLGIPNYDLCIVSIGDDFLSSLQTTFTLDELGAKKIIARATNSRQENFLLRNGASAVVFPERELGFWTAIRYSSDNISNYVDLTDGYSILEIDVPERWNGKKIGELDVRRKYHLNVLGVRTPRSGKSKSSGASGFGAEKPIFPGVLGFNRGNSEDSEMNMDVRYDTVLRSGQTMLVLGKNEHIQKIL
ncbi:MAG: TrkA family potassium uptake protein [Eubacteriales bacterium]|nr:TrkA family potassium uptake protein [Eubacteriales bacterium]